MFTAESGEETWIQHVAQTYSLDESVVRRLFEEFLALTDSTVRERVVASHLRFQAQGLSNQQIFQRLQREVSRSRFRVPVPSERQLRRWIYG